MCLLVLRNGDSFISSIVSQSKFEARDTTQLFSAAASLFGPWGWLLYQWLRAGRPQVHQQVGLYSTFVTVIDCIASHNIHVSVKFILHPLLFSFVL